METQPKDDCMHTTISKEEFEEELKILRSDCEWHIMSNICFFYFETYCLLTNYFFLSSEFSGERFDVSIKDPFKQIVEVLKNNTTMKRLEMGF